MKLSTGTEFYANHNIVGIDPYGCILEGFDGVIDEQLTREERLELADLMIVRWNKFKELTDKQYKMLQMGLECFDDGELRDSGFEGTYR